MRTHALIMAAGSSRRMQEDGKPQTDKCFEMVGGKQLFIWSVEAFQNAPSIEEIVVVTAGRNHSLALDALDCGFSKVVGVVVGGSERHLSVRNGLEALGESEAIAVHDGARPFITPEDIEKGIRLLEEKRAAGIIAAMPVVDTIKRIRRNGDGTAEIVDTVDRNELMAAATPQIFRSDPLIEAHSIEYSVAPTDDAMMVQALGHKIYTYECGFNIKVTRPGDLEMARAMLALRGSAKPVLS